MNTKFAKALLMGSVLTVGAFGLVACGDDSSTSPSNGGNTPIVIPSTQDQIIQFTPITANVVTETLIKFTGSATLNFVDTLSSASPENIKFTSLTFDIAKVGADGSLTATAAKPTVTNMPALPTQKNLVLAEMGVMVDLNDEAYTECGEYKLIATAKANDGVKDFENTQTASFQRDASLCATAPESSSGTTPEQPTGSVSMTICEIQASTNLAPGIDLASCTASASATADIVLTKTTGDFNITSGNGTLFSPIDNETMTPNNYKDDYGVGYWPEVVNGRDALMSDFMYKAITGTELVKVSENYSANILVAKTTAFNEATGAGFFAFAVTKATEGNNGDYNVTLKVYKAK